MFSPTSFGKFSWASLHMIFIKKGVEETEKLLLSRLNNMGPGLNYSPFTLS